MTFCATAVLRDVKHQLGTQLRVPPFTCKLLAGTELLNDDLQLLEEIVAVRGSAFVLVRCPGDEKEFKSLFGELAAAIHAGRTQEARHLVDMGAGFDVEGRALLCSGSSMLHLAIRAGLTELALHLLAQGADVHARNESGRQPLAQAVIKRNELVMEALLEAGADVRAVDVGGKPALLYALQSAGRDPSAGDRMLARLVRAGAYEAGEQMTMKALHPAATSNPEGSELPNQAVTGCSPVLLTCRLGLPLAAQAFIEAGADVTQTDESGCSALVYANRLGMTEVAERISKAANLPVKHAPAPHALRGLVSLLRAACAFR